LNLFGVSADDFDDLVVKHASRFGKLVLSRDKRVFQPSFDELGLHFDPVHPLSPFLNRFSIENA